MVGLTGRQCMSLSGRESLRPLVGLVLTPPPPPLDASEWMEANLTCMCVWPSFHSSALLGMSSTPPHVRALKINQTLLVVTKKQSAGQVSAGSYFRLHRRRILRVRPLFANRQDQTQSQLYPIFFSVQLEHRLCNSSCLLVR